MSTLFANIRSLFGWLPVLLLQYNALMLGTIRFTDRERWKKTNVTTYCKHLVNLLLVLLANHAFYRLTT